MQTMMGEQAADLNALVAGIRSHKETEHEYITARLREIRREIQYGTRCEKSQAVLKLWYLRMMGYDISWFQFGCLEVMSSSGNLQLKRPGFSACAATFIETTSVALLTVNLFKKELLQPLNTPSINLTLTCMASMCTTDIARDLHQDVLKLLSSTKTSVRRKAVLCLLRMILKHPQALLVCYPKMKEVLTTDDDAPVVACALSAMLELTIRNPKLNLQLAPTVYGLLLTPQSNWTTLKALRLLHFLCPFEPRLPLKLLEVLTNLLNDTTLAHSIEVEVLRLILHHYNPSQDIVKTALRHLESGYLQSTDPNLKCIGLLLLSDVVKESSAFTAAALSTLFGESLITKILGLVATPDPLMRSAAVSILKHCVTPANFLTAADELMKLGHSRHHYLRALLELGEVNHFAVVEDLQNYCCLLAHIARLDHSSASIIQIQFETLLKDAPTLRPFLLKCFSLLLWGGRSLNTSSKLSSLNAKPPPPTQLKKSPSVEATQQLSPVAEIAPKISNDGDVEVSYHPVGNFDAKEFQTTEIISNKGCDLAEVISNNTVAQSEDLTKYELIPEVLLSSIIKNIGKFSEDFVCRGLDLNDAHEVTSSIAKIQLHVALPPTLQSTLHYLSDQFQFTSCIINQIHCLAQTTECSPDLRLSCSLSCIKLAEVMSERFNENDFENSLLLFKETLMSFTSSTDPRLQLHAKLLKILLGAKNHTTLGLLTKLYKQRNSISTITTSTPDMLKTDDLLLPFGISDHTVMTLLESTDRDATLHSKHKNGDAKHLSSFSSSRQPTTSAQNSPKSRKKKLGMSTQTKRRHAVEGHSGNEMSSTPSQSSASTLNRLWNKSYTDNNLSIYSFIVGRNVDYYSSLNEQQILTNYNGTKIPFTVEVLCKNNTCSANDEETENNSLKSQQSENVIQVLHNVIFQQRQDDTRTYPQYVISKDLVDKSKKTSVVLYVDIDNVLDHSSLIVDIKYSTIKDTCELPHKGTAMIYIPSYHLLQPLKISEDNVFLLMKSQTASFAARSSSDMKEFSIVCKTEKEGNQPMSPSTHWERLIEPQLRRLIITASELNHFHCLLKMYPHNIKDKRIAGLLIATAWTPDTDALEGLAKDPAVSGSTPVVVGLITIIPKDEEVKTEVNDESVCNCEQIAFKLQVSFRGKDQKFCDRLADDFLKVFNEIINLLQK